MMALMPTDPTPKTASVLPSLTSSVFMTAPAPVWMPQPSGAISARSVSCGTRTRHDLCTSVCRANVLCPKKVLKSGVSPSSLKNAAVPSARLPPKFLSLKS